MTSNPQHNPESSVPPSEPSDSNLQPSTFADYRGNGKVARLPKPLRDQINQWVLDGASYPDIIQRLGDHGKGLNPGHLCEWKKRGFQDWLLEQAWLAETRARQEPAADLSADFDATQLNHAALQLGTLHIFEALRDLGPASPPPSPRPTNGAAVPSPRREGQREGGFNPPADSASQLENRNSRIRNPRSQLDLKLGGDSAAFVRLINALARASRETMLVQKYRDACAQARAALNPLKDPKRKLTESERRAIVLQVDDILGLGSSEGEETEPPPTPPTNEPPSLATAV
jgi:hypothetical protein